MEFSRNEVNSGRPDGRLPDATGAEQAHLRRRVSDALEERTRSEDRGDARAAVLAQRRQARQLDGDFARAVTTALDRLESRIAAQGLWLARMAGHMPMATQERLLSLADDLQTLPAGESGRRAAAELRRLTQGLLAELDARTDSD